MQTERLGKAASVFIWTAFVLIVLLFAGIAREHLSQPDLVSAVLYPEDRRTLPDFRLTDSNREAFDKSRLYGKWSFLFFGYTRCPDICPHTLQTLRWAAERIRRDGGREEVRFVFVSVDPARDDYAHLKDYVSFFDPEFIGLAGERAQLDALTEAMDAPYRRMRAESDGGDYFMEHPAQIFLISPRAELYALLPPPHSAETIAEDFRRLREHFTQQHATLSEFPTFNLAKTQE
jgi:protein SCO1